MPNDPSEIFGNLNFNRNFLPKRVSEIIQSGQLVPQTPTMNVPLFGALAQRDSKFDIKDANRNAIIPLDSDLGKALVEKHSKTTEGGPYKLGKEPNLLDNFIPVYDQPTASSKPRLIGFRPITPDDNLY